MPRSEIAQLLRRRGFARYFAVVASARASGAMFNVAGVLLVLERTGSLTLAAVVVAAGTVPSAVTGPFLGAWLDIARSRRRLLILDRVVTIAALLGLLLLAGHGPNWLLPAIAVVYGLTTPLSSGAFSSVLPEIAGPELLGVANTFEATSVNVAFILGPALAGVIAGTAGPPAAVEAQIAAGVVLALLIAGDESFELRPEHDAEPPSRIGRTVAEGLASIWRIKPLRWNSITGFIYVMAWGTLNVGFPAYAVSVGASAHASGYMWACISFGSMLSGFALRTATSHMSPTRLIGVSFTAMSLSVLLWPLAGGLAVALALVTLTGALEGPSLVALISVRQSLAPVHLRGQIFSTVTSLSLTGVAAGSALAGPFHDAFGTTASVYAFAGLMLLSGAIAVASAERGAALRAG